MTFSLQFNTSNPLLRDLSLGMNEVLFIVGANGVGKSSLLHSFAMQNRGKVKKISAHRQTWMSSDTLDMTPSQKLQTEQNIQNTEARPEFKNKDQYGAQKASMTIYDIIDAENVRARKIASEVDGGRISSAQEMSRTGSPIGDINELLRLSNIPIELNIKADERLMASKDGGPEYSATDLSDGERNALLIAGSVLTAKPGTLILVDEPERHLHRSISSPLLSHLFEKRTDCSFVVSTHDHNLPLDHGSARVVLVRSCDFSGASTRSWEADLIPSSESIDEVTKHDLLGARRKLIFVEGTSASMDLPLYSLVFPAVSVIAKGSCVMVEQAVSGIRAGDDFHWVDAYGIIDGDNIQESELAEKIENGVYPLPYHSVESIYFHPKIIDALALRQATISGGDPEEMAKMAIRGGIDAIRGHEERLLKNVVVKIANKHLVEQLPEAAELTKDLETQVTWNGHTTMQQKMKMLSKALDSFDWEAVIKEVPIKRSAAPNQISTSLNFRNPNDYQRAVLQLLMTDEEILRFVRRLFLDLHQKLEM